MEDDEEILVPQPMGDLHSDNVIRQIYHRLVLPEKPEKVKLIPLRKEGENITVPLNHTFIYSFSCEIYRDWSAPDSERVALRFTDDPDQYANVNELMVGKTLYPKKRPDHEIAITALLLFKQGYFGNWRDVMNVYCAANRRKMAKPAYKSLVNPDDPNFWEWFEYDYRPKAEEVLRRVEIPVGWHFLS